MSRHLEQELTLVRVAHVMTVAASLSFLSGQIAFLKKRGYEFAVITSPDAELDAFGRAEGVRTFGVEMPRAVTPVRDLTAVAGLVRALREFRPDLVHAHTPKGGLLGMIAATVCGVPARVYHMRGLPFVTATGARRALLVGTERVSCRLAHRTLCVSRSLREVALATGLGRADDIRVLLGGSGNGVDSAVRFNPSRLGSDTRARVRRTLGVPPDSVVIGFVGRLVRDKGVEELAAAWQELRTKHPLSHLVLAGSFEPQDPVSARCRSSLETDPRVHFAGWVDEMPELYAALDVVALPSYREGLPNVPLEAAAMQLPVVATLIPGCVDAVANHETGTLVAARDPLALEAALDAYVASAGLRRAHGAAARERVVREFGQEALWAAIANTYEEALASRGRVASSAMR